MTLALLVGADREMQLVRQYQRYLREVNSHLPESWRLTPSIPEGHCYTEEETQLNGVWVSNRKVQGEMNGVAR